MYRTKHKKCIYCKWYSFSYKMLIDGVFETHKCLAKDKSVRGRTRISRWFCPCFEIKEEKELE